MVAVGEGIKLLDVAEGVVGLAFDPLAQRRLERAVRGGLEGAGGQGEAGVDGENARLGVGDRDDDGDELGGDRIR